MFIKEAVLTISDLAITKALRKVLLPFPYSCIFTIPDHYKQKADGERFLLIDESLFVEDACLSLQVIGNSTYYPNLKQ